MIALLFKASIIITILWLFYKLALERESFFGANRFFLIGSLILAFTLPFVSLPPLFHQQGVISQLIEPSAEVRESDILSPPELPVVTPLDIEVPRVESLPTSPPPNLKNPIPVKPQRGVLDWLLIIYYFGVLVFSLNLLTQIGSILLQVIRSKEKIHDTEYIIINSPLIKEPCSFFNYVFIHPERYEYDTFEQILSHEAIHVKKFHTIDLLLSELAAIILWFNPLIWLFRKDVEKNIEYQTDDLLLHKSEVKKDQYQMNLLRVATYHKPLAITTNYNQSLIKKRILKMSAKKSSPHSYWKYAFIAPVLFSTLLVLNKPSASFASLTHEFATTDILPEVQEVEIPAKPQTIALEVDKPESFSSPVLPNLETDQGSLDNSESITEVPTVHQTAPVSSDCQSLLSAIKEEDLSSIRQLLKVVHPDCSALDTEYIQNGRDRITLTVFRTPLVTTAKIGNVAIAKLLIEAGADPSLHQAGEQNPMNTAYAHGHSKLGSYIAGIMGQNNSFKQMGRTLFVSTNKDQPALPSVQATGKDIHKDVYGVGTPLIVACKKGDLKRAKQLLSKGVDINKDSYGVGTALIVAVKKRDLETARYLISKGADLDIDSYGIGTALIVAVKQKDWQMMQYLISQGADLDIDSYGVGTALIVALKRGDMETADYLIKQGADMDVDSYGVGTALIAALKKGDMETANYLISQGADLNEDSYGIGTALIVAMKKGDMQTVQYLIQRGADLDVDSYGIGTALIMATKKSDFNKMQYLLSAGADIDEDSYGIGTALIVAVKNQDTKAVKYLMSKGADVNVNSYGIGTALSVATKQGDREILSILTSKNKDQNFFSPRNRPSQREY
ncbi:MAG: ankyrin repeat domain-containing protein [Bacteroidota bacterium]